MPVGGDWKVALRLHKGTDILAAMLRRPADPEHGEEAIELRQGFITLDLDDPSGEPAEGTPGWLGGVVLAAVTVLWLCWAWLTVRAAQASRAALAPPPAAQGKGRRGTKASHRGSRAR